MLPFEKTIDKIKSPEVQEASSFLFNDHYDNISYYESLILKGLETVKKQLIKIGKPFSGIHYKDLKPAFDQISLDQPLAQTEGVITELEKLYLDHAIYFHHPKYAAHLNCPIVSPAIMAELILSSINSSLDTWDQSAGGTYIEQELIQWTLSKAGISTGGDGVFTSGGTQSNLMGMLLARDVFCYEKLNHNVTLNGLPPASGKFRIFVSEVGHFSIKKAAALMGLGHNAVVTVPVDQEFKMDTHKLEKSIQESLASGYIPIAIVATAGTTDFGSIDPLNEIAEIAHKYKLWMHTDAAYGCGLLVSDQNRTLISGIQYSDSITVDYHKSFFQPVSSSALLVGKKESLDYFTYHADYLNPLKHAQDGVPNQVNKTIQTTRRFDALKLWITLRVMGPKVIGAYFDQNMRLAKKVFLMIYSDETMEVLHQPELSTVIFRYRPSHYVTENIIDQLNIYIRATLFKSGEAIVASTKVNGREYLKFTLLNPTATIKEFRETLDLIKHHGEQYFNQSR